MMNLFALHLTFCLALSFLLVKSHADKPEHKELNENRLKNYAAGDCAKVIETNPEAKKSSYILNGQTDEYMLNPCGAKIWFVIELCDNIQATKIEVASYELYSSNPKDFTVYVSSDYPAPAWNLIGHFEASDSRSLQAFDLKQVGFGKYIRVDLHSHYGTEHYCVISEIKVYGVTMMETYLDQANTQENGNETHKHNKIPKRKTSAFRVYRNMMTDPNMCGLAVEGISDLSSMPNVTFIPKFHEPKEQPTIKPVPPQPTQAPNVTNKTAPLKPSIFVELGNKVKAMELSLKTQIEDIEKRLNEKDELVRKAEAKVTRLKLQFESFALIVITYYVYKLMLEMM